MISGGRDSSQLDSVVEERAPFTCRVCPCADGSRYTVREMMFATREPFEYFECHACGCLQLMHPPFDMRAHYPREYYAFAATAARNGIAGRLRRLRNRGALLGHGPVPRLLAAVRPYTAVNREWFDLTGTTTASRILDVGCGAGNLLRDLADAGFRSPLGVDPFIDADIDHGNGARVRRCTLDQIDGIFDLVMLHHSLEHMKEQRETLSHVGRLLAPNGYCLIRVPTVSSWAWEHYRERWVQIDAPRHLFLHTTTSLRDLAGKAGLTLERVVFDSTEFQFTGSELYLRDIGLVQLPGAYTAAQLRHFRRRARRLNDDNRGDQAAFYFRRAKSSAGDRVA